MTAIIGYADGTNVWMGGDTRSVAGWEPVLMQEKKVFHRDGLLFGGTGLGSQCETIRRFTEIPKGKKKLDALIYLNDRLAPAMRKALDDHHQKMVMGDWHCAFLIGFKGMLYYCNDDLYIRPCLEMIDTIGSGQDITKGAFMAFRKCGMEVEKAMLNALEICGDRNLSVGPPYHVEKI